MSELVLYSDAVARFQGLVKANHIPPRVFDALLGLSERQIELFCWVPNAPAAAGADDPSAAFYASDFFRELLKAMEALDWPEVGVLLHRGNPKIAYRM